MSTKSLQLERLKELLNAQNPIAAKEYIDNIVNFFDCPLTKIELDLTLEKLFCTKTGTIFFLKNSLKSNKLFHDSNVNIFTLWYNLLTKNADTANFTPYTANIIQCCMKFIASSIAPSAKERERATMVLQILFQNNLVEEDLATEVVERSLNVFNLKKPPEMFTQQLFKLLGIIARFYPISISEESAQRIKIECFKTLDANMVSQEIRYRALTGAMECLNDYLYNFAPSPASEPEACDRIYTSTRTLSTLPDDITQKTAFRAGLDLFTHHSTLFSKQIYRDFKFWHECLGKWLGSSIYDERRRGIYGFYAFHKIIAEQLKTDDTNSKNILEFFLNEFRKTLESADSKPAETRIAIRGFGSISLLCKQFLPAILEDMISLVVQKCDLILMADDSAMRDLLDHFPDYIHALSTVIREIENPQISEVLAENLKNIMIRLIRDFHYLPTLQCANVSNSICNAFNSLYLTDVTLLERVLNKVIFEGVVWTCSHKHVFDANADWSENIDWKDNITYKSFSILWDALLDETPNSRSSSYDKSIIVDRIFDHLMLTLFKILEKLDLRTKKRVYTDEDGRDQEFHFCDPNFDLCPIRPKDFHIFINLVDFYRDIWPKLQRPYTLNWIEEFCERMVKFSLRNPFISGFSKLLEVGLRTAVKLKVFEDNLAPRLEVTLSHAFKVMIVKCQRVSGELQIATIELVLQYPVKFYQNCLIDMIPVFECAFDLGKSMVWLASLAIDCLEKISNFNDSEDLTKLHATVLPLLDCYLHGNSNMEFLSIREGRGGNKIRKPGKPSKSHIEFQDIQAKIVSLLGKLHPQAATMLVMNSAMNENLVKWDSRKCVHLDLKLPDISVTVQLDTLVPRICQLALTSTDRQTKIAACELVHALVLYMIGARGHQGQIWKELCKKTLELGCDGDATVQQIFEPLLMQVMHFMSKYENLDRGVEEIMDALMEGISSKSNFGLRDLSACCLREFVEWSIKQTTPQQLAASPVSIEIILGRLKMYSFDSDASKRVGAALAFNNLYRRLREEESVCDIFFVELLYTFCVNFKLSEELTTMPPNDDMNPDLEMISEALDHIVRVLSERSYLFEKHSAKRRVPTALKSGTLRDILRFLMFEAGSKKMFYRRICIKLAHTLAPRITGLGSIWDFLQTDSISDDDLLEICEGPSDGFGIAARPDINFLTLLHSESSERSLYSWLEYLLGSLECYIWLLKEKAIHKSKHFFRGSNIFCAIECFLKNICWKPMAEIVAIPSSGSNVEISNNMDVLKCLIVIHIVDFLIEFLQSECAREECVVFWKQDTKELLQDLILQLIYEPKTLHLDFRLEKIFSQLDNRVQKFCKQIQSNCPDKQFFNQLNQEMFVTLVRKLDNLSQKMTNMFKIEGAFDTRPSYVNGILHILKIANFEEMESSQLQTLVAICDRIMKLLFDGIKRTSFGKEVTVTLTENVKSFGNSLMRISFGVKDYSTEVIEFMLNDVELYTVNLDSKIKHGQLYFELYEKVIYQEATLSFFEKCFDLFPSLSEDQQSYLLRVLTEVLENKSKSDRRRSSSSFRNIIDTCIQNLQALIEHYMQKPEKFYFIEFLRVLASISSNDPLDINEQVPALGQFIISKLSATQLSLEKKCKIISLLPLMVGVNDYEKTELMSALEHLQCQHFPLRSTEFSKNSLQETCLKYAFVTLLNALVGSKSYVLLEFLLKCTASDEVHLVEDIIRKELKAFTLCLSEGQQVGVLNRTLETVLNERYEPTIRITIYRRFLLNIFIHCSEKALMELFRTKIKIINMLLESNYRVGSSGRAVEQALANRIIGYGLVEHFFGTVRKELYWSVTCPIAIELLGKPKADSELVGTFTKKAFYVRSEVFSTDNKEALELFRQYQCSAYCALSSLVSNTQTELKFYSKFLFEENSRKNELIWSNLVDCSKHYVFSGQEMEEYAKIRKRFVSIRKLDVRPSVTLNTITSSRRLQTQNIMESSLSQDVRGIDMTSYSVRPYGEALRRQELRSAEIQSVRLESHDVNKHEVMAMVCGVIKFMHTNNITPVIADSSVKRSYPWVQAIANSIGSCENHKNVRVFLAQVVDNCSEVFQQFAHVLFKPILRMLADECAGSTLNFFITDMIALLVSWSSKGFHLPQASDELSLVQELLKFVMKNAWSETREILKFNLEIVQTMLSMWKGIIVVPSNLLLDMITRSQRNDSDSNECGIVFLGMILSNELIPWTELTKVLYINAILTNIENLKPSIYQPAAYSLGAALEVLSKSGDQDSADNLFQEIQTRLHSLNNKKDRKCEKRFTDILYNIHKSSPQIVDRLREVICFKIPTAIGTTKRSYLEMILSRVESFEEDEVYNTIIGIGIKDLLKQSDFQLLALHILNRALPMIKNHDLSLLFEHVEDSLQLKRVDCRDIGYEICIYAAQNFGSDLKNKAIKLILKGISDPEVEIQKRIYHFWSKEAQIPSILTERILFLLKNYALEGEKHFLGLCTQLLLDPAIESPESKKQIFQFEDDRDSKLHEYHINTKLRSRTTYTLPPMFAESTQARPSLFKATQLCSLVRNTNADYAFEPTQDPIVVSQVNEKFTLYSQNSMPFKIGSQVLDRRSKLVGIKNPKEDSASTLRRRRFLKDKEKEQKDKVLRVISVRQKNIEESARKAIENDVGLYRRYRFGEYPDLLINNLAFLLPLQALVRRDVQIAQQLFVASLSGILEARECDASEFLEQINNIFKNILSNSRMCDSTIFSSLLEVSLLKPNAFNLPPDQVAKFAKESKNLTLGALYLEKRLISDWDHEIAVTLEPAHWLQLADIYSSLKEYEVVSSIFADKLRTDPRLSNAIELRANGRADEAQTLLVEVIGRNVHMEHYYAYNCYYECSIELSDWSHVTEAINNEIDDLEELWTDSYNLNFLLPKLMHAKIQLLLEGDLESRSFLRNISEWMLATDRAKLMKNEFSEELMMLSIVTKDFRQCRVLYENFVKNFLWEWNITGSFCTKTKLESLLRAQRVSEIDFYAQTFIKGFDEYSTEEVCRRWNSCSIDPTESLRMWNTLVGYRKYIAALGSKTLQDAQIKGPERDLSKSVFHMTTQLFNAAVHQNNFSLAQKVFERLSPSRTEPIELIAHELSRIQNIFLQTHRTTDCVGFIETAWNAITTLLQKPVLANYPQQHTEALELRTKIATQTIEKVEQEIFNSSQEMALKRITKNKSNDLRIDFIELALEAHRAKVMVAKSSSSSIDSRTLADASYSLAQFSYDVLNKIETDCQQKTEFEEIFLESVLEAMKYGSKEACQLFPCVLQLSSIESGLLHDRFRQCSADVPVWTYLAWIPQILSSFELNQSCYLDDVLRSIALKYPDALRYPFSTWYRQAKINSSLSRDEGHSSDRSVIHQIMDNLHHKLCDKFMKSFRYLAVPEAFLMSQLQSFDRDIRHHSSINDVHFSKLLEKLLKDVYCEEEGLRGVAYRRLQVYKLELEKVKTMSFTCNEDRIRKKLSEVVGALQRQLFSAFETNLRLETICPWLASYQWCGEEECIALPGLSAENSFEFMESIKIVRFGAKVQVLVSQRYPLRILIHGSNGRSYDFLVKHGEDLKQDQRIQQILKLMSQKLREDQRCQAYNLAIRTYQVVPIDRNCGILSWVNDTVTLNDFILNCFERRCSDSRNIMNGLNDAYLEFIERHSQLPSNAVTMKYGTYGIAACKYTREELINNLRSLENTIDFDIVKKALMDLALSPGSFFALRNNFATSMAAMNIAQWILGIGDRHLKNTLINVKDGSMTGIDFGFTFGSGTRDQKVPELIPFRLTSHLVNAMSPMGTSGLIFKCMAHTLRVFRSVDRLLMAYMEVFIREPSVNWLDLAMKRINDDEDSILCAWEPKDRIDIARCKLQGSNPMYLFERELNVGVVSKNIEYLEGYMKILRGHRQFNIRSRLPKDKLSVEDQVKCLIDQATDPAVLGISYVGFSPWI
ncbi:DNA-dependent protein kinase catalytic subunit-like isoform X2 [Eupeodes corollae]|uniref:DNA-dependent protein kinase catalytic subunit-like isoform X2 n=1 Tax=Eupeodes corollae TaxID=290404 RepID=UPI0024907C1C|nr:DNA-dependent protein kinase catalytic subunit-like isoform X2 [Eupeodes corollae]